MPRFTVDVYYSENAIFKVAANGVKHAAQKGLDLFNELDIAEGVEVEEVCVTPEGGNLQQAFSVDEGGCTVEDWTATFGAESD